MFISKVLAFKWGTWIDYHQAPYIMEPFLCSMQRITYLNKHFEEFSEAALVKHLSIKLKEYCQALVQILVPTGSKVK